MVMGNGFLVEAYMPYVDMWRSDTNPTVEEPFEHPVQDEIYSNWKKKSNRTTFNANVRQL